MDDFLLEMFMREIKLQCRFAVVAYSGITSELQLTERRHQFIQEQQRRLSEIHQGQLSDITKLARTSGDTESRFQQMLQELKDKQATERIELQEDGDNWPVFFYCYSFLVHAAIVSKILWSGTTVFKKEKEAVGPENLDTLKALRATRSMQLRKELKIEGEWKIEKKDLRDDLEHYDERIEAWYLSSPLRNSIDLALLSRSAVSGFDPMDFRRNFDPSSMSFLIEGNDHDFHAMVDELSDIFGRATRWLQENSRQAKWHRAAEFG